MTAPKAEPKAPAPSRRPADATAPKWCRSSNSSPRSSSGSPPSSKHSEWVIKEQQEKIKAIEIKSTEKPVASAAPAAKLPPPPAILVETGGTKLRVSGLFQGWYTAGTRRDRHVPPAPHRTEVQRRSQPAHQVGGDGRSGQDAVADDDHRLDGRAAVITDTSVSQSGRMLQDAFVSLNWKPAFSVEVGQQKVPLGLEGTAVVRQARRRRARALHDRQGARRRLRRRSRLRRDPFAARWPAARSNTPPASSTASARAFNDVDQQRRQGRSPRASSRSRRASRACRSAASIAREGIELVRRDAARAPGR